MPSLKAIRLRITSVKSNQKITKAMKLVAAARLRKATQAIVELRPYARKTAEVLSAVSARGGNDGGEEETQHPLLVARPVKTVAILVLTSDRGLAGAFNTNVQRAVDRRIREVRDRGEEAVLITIGRKGRDFFRRRGVQIAHDFTGAYAGGSHRAAEIARQIIEDFKEGQFDRVEIAYTEFRSAISQRVTVEQLLPVQPAISPSQAGAQPAGASREIVAASSDLAQNGSGAQGDYLYEPDPKALLERLLPMYVEVMVYRAMLESVASEHGARMTAMENATKNAKKMIDSLTLQYNRARQAAITKELMEIIGGAEALRA